MKKEKALIHRMDYGFFSNKFSSLACMIFYQLKIKMVGIAFRLQSVGFVWNEGEVENEFKGKTNNVCA